MRMRKKPYVPPAIVIVELEPPRLAEGGEPEALEKAFSRACPRDIEQVPSNVERKR